MALGMSPDFEMKSAHVHAMLHYQATLWSESRDPNDRNKSFGFWVFPSVSASTSSFGRISRWLSAVV